MAQTRLNIALGSMVLLPFVLFMWVVFTYQPPLTQLSWSWVPSLDIDLMFRLDGLSVLFAGLITGVGLLVQLYSLAYMKGKPARFSFHLLLTLFMLSMLGLVLADNILLLFVFWELTTLTSYLLIGYNHEEAKSRKNALQAMLITGAGGLTLLAGLLMLGNLADSYQLSLIIERAASYQDSVWFIPSLICVLAGAFAKSAQFPLHFWLPGAMAAPTPVSAYLHSATMVKAGVYLLARLLPVYGETALWGWSLGLAGAATGLWCGLLALRQTDLKLMLAFSTNVVLGKLVMLLGIGTETAVSAALLLIAAHAFYKAGLFMVIGIVDKATGTREFHQLRALKPVLGISFVAAVVGAASKAGFPPTMGFLSKEYMYKAGAYTDVFVTIAMVAINILLVTLALVLVIKPFLGEKDNHTAEIKPVEQYKLLWMPPLLLTCLGLIVPLLMLSQFQAIIIDPAMLAMLGNGSPEAVKLWSGINLALILSLLTLISGAVLYRFYTPLHLFLVRLTNALPNGPDVYARILDAVMKLASWQTRTLQHGQLSGYTLQFFIVLAAILVYGVYATGALPNLSFDAEFYEYAIGILMVGCAAIVLASPSRLTSIATLGMIGFLTTLIFMIYSAPDVSKTQLLVETLSVVFIAIVMRKLPLLNAVPKPSRRRRLVQLSVAGTIGLCMTLLMLMITSDPLDQSLPEYFSQYSYPIANGRNVVNVILVDFRAFDTLGEVVVVVVAAIAAISVVRRFRKGDEQ